MFGQWIAIMKILAPNLRQVLSSDTWGVPTFYTALILNVSSLFSLANVDVILTLIISGMSGVWLYYKILNERAKYKREKEQENVSVEQEK